MALFRRKKSSDSDIDSYYASERRKRIGVAWLLGFVTLVLTVLLALAFFYGGRWVYRTVFDDDQPTSVTDQNNGQDQPSEESENDESNGLLDDITIDGSEDEATPSTDDPSGIIGSETEEEAGQDQAGDAENLPSSGPSELPSTGPEDLVSVFVAVAIIAGLAHKLVYAKFLSK